MEKGGIFIADRWRDSTRAYQGYGLKIDLGLIDILTEFSCDGACPDITFLLDIDPELGLTRITGHEFEGERYDKIEARDLDYHARVNQGYRELAIQNPDRFRVIPYIRGNPHQMQVQVRRHVNRFIREHHLEDMLARSMA